MGTWRLAAVMALGLAMLVGASSAPAQEKAPEASPKLAILIVGDEANAEMLREEKALIAEMTRLLAGTGGEATKYPTVRTLQVYSYHFNQPRERQYCEKKLNILAEDLLFVGLVELKDKLPRRVVYRLDRITRPSRAATDILARAEEVLSPGTVVVDAPDESPSPAASASPSPKPAASASPKPAASPSISAPPRVSSTAWCVQVGSFTELQNAQDLVGKLKEKGYDSRIDQSTRNGANLFRVYVGSYANRQEAQTALDKLKSDGFDKAFVAAPEEG